MDEREMRRRAAEATVARVGTIDHSGRVHVVPIVFVINGDTLYSSTDEHPPAKRLRNLQRDPRTTILVDIYDDDWSKVWWVRMRGTGRVVEDEAERDGARKLLWDKYPQFTKSLPSEGGGPVMAVDISEWSGWSYTD
jgi:PPOX class probable F420-dependent enzyme